MSARPQQRMHSSNNRTKRSNSKNNSRVSSSSSSRISLRAKKAVNIGKRTGDEVKKINSGLNYDGTEKVDDYFRKQVRLSLESESDIEGSEEKGSMKKSSKLVGEMNRLSVSSLSDCEDESYIARIEAQRKRDSLSDFGLSPETQIQQASNSFKKQISLQQSGDRARNSNSNFKETSNDKYPQKYNILVQQDRQSSRNEEKPEQNNIDSASNQYYLNIPSRKISSFRAHRQQQQLYQKQISRQSYSGGFSSISNKPEQLSDVSSDRLDDLELLRQISNMPAVALDDQFKQQLATPFSQTKNNSKKQDDFEISLSQSEIVLSAEKQEDLRAQITQKNQDQDKLLGLNNKDNQKLLKLQQRIKQMEDISFIEDSKLSLGDKKKNKCESQSKKDVIRTREVEKSSGYSRKIKKYNDADEDLEIQIASDEEISQWLNDNQRIINEMSQRKKNNNHNNFATENRSGSLLDISESRVHKSDRFSDSVNKGATKLSFIEEISTQQQNYQQQNKQFAKEGVKRDKNEEEYEKQNPQGQQYQKNKGFQVERQKEQLDFVDKGDGKMHIQQQQRRLKRRPSKESSENEQELKEKEESIMILQSDRLSNGREAHQETGQEGYQEFKEGFSEKTKGQMLRITENKEFLLKSAEDNPKKQMDIMSNSHSYQELQEDDEQEERISQQKQQQQEFKNSRNHSMEVESNHKQTIENQLEMNEDTCQQVPFRERGKKRKMITPIRHREQINDLNASSGRDTSVEIEKSEYLKKVSKKLKKLKYPEDIHKSLENQDSISVNSSSFSQITSQRSKSQESPGSSLDLGKSRVSKKNKKKQEVLAEYGQIFERGFHKDQIEHEVQNQGESFGKEGRYPVRKRIRPLLGWCERAVYGKQGLLHIIADSSTNNLTQVNYRIPGFSNAYQSKYFLQASKSNNRSRNSSIVRKLKDKDHRINESSLQEISEEPEETKGTFSQQDKLRQQGMEGKQIKGIKIKQGQNVKKHLRQKSDQREAEYQEEHKEEEGNEDLFAKDKSSKNLEKKNENQKNNEPKKRHGSVEDSHKKQAEHEAIQLDFQQKIDYIKSQLVELEINKIELLYDARNSNNKDTNVDVVPSSNLKKFNLQFNYTLNSGESISRADKYSQKINPGCKIELRVIECEPKKLILKLHGDPSSSSYLKTGDRKQLRKSTQFTLLHRNSTHNKNELLPSALVNFTLISGSSPKLKQ